MAAPGEGWHAERSPCPPWEGGRAWRDSTYSSVSPAAAPAPAQLSSPLESILSGFPPTILPLGPDASLGAGIPGTPGWGQGLCIGPLGLGEGLLRELSPGEGRGAAQTHRVISGGPSSTAGHRHPGASPHPHPRSRLSHRPPAPGSPAPNWGCTSLLTPRPASQAPDKGAPSTLIGKPVLGE